jgi:hypothetical protein
MIHDVKNILKHFVLPGKFIRATVDITGLINDTYIVTFRDEQDIRFILQRINIQVFRKPREVMMNIETILNHQAEKIRSDPEHPDPERGVLQLIMTHGGRSYHTDEKGDYWRVYRYIENAKVFNTVDTASQAFEAAITFGRFSRYLSDMDVAKMHYTIPDFHNITMRYGQLKQSVEGDVANRKRSCEKEIVFVMDHEYLTEPSTGLLARKEIPIRVTHNDTKINNVLMDEQSEKGLCVIDLDTVMPGTVLSDFGDMVRTFTNTRKEDDPHIDQVAMRLNIFQALTEGYLEEANRFLEPVEKKHLVYGGKLITLMQGIRNLTDYLVGDVYYKIDYDEHNLHRAQNQFALLKSIEDQEDEMDKVVQRCIKK